MTEKTNAAEQSAGIDLADMPELVIVTGMSGAGRTEAMHAFEDLGYFCVDNLPASLIGELLAITGLPGQPNEHRRLAVVCDARNRDFFSSLMGELKALKDQGIDYRVLFLDAADEKLIARYKSSRRRHPLCTDGASIAQGIQRERDLLFSLREGAHHVIDTTSMLPPQLKATIRALFAPGEERAGLAVTVYSFGFKHGAPLDADLVIDVRFLPNPYYDPELRPLTGLDAPVRDFVHVPQGDRGLHDLLEGAARLRHAGLRLRGQAAARHRRRLHGRPAPQRRDRRGDARTTCAPTAIA